MNQATATFYNHGEGISVRGLSVRWPSDATPLLRDIDLDLEHGEVVGLCGRSGSGKSTLLHLLAGLIPWHRRAEVHGSLRLDGDPIAELDPGQRAHLLATCLDRPDAQLFLPTPHHELQGARRLYGSSRSSQGALLVESVIDLLHLGPLLHRPTGELSSGERQRVALALVLTACPRPVLMDEPTAFLDAEAVAILPELLTELRRRGGAVLLAEQAGWRLAGGVDRWLETAGQGIRSRLLPQVPALPPPPQLSRDEPVLQTHDLAVAREGRELLSDVNLELRAGEVVLLSGANGSGKSTLALALAGLSPARKGAVDRRAGRVALMLPTAELQLFGTTVTEELAAAGAGPAEMARVLRRHRLEALAARSPWTLSRGERQRLVHAALDLLRPSVLIVDEPGQGLDPEDLRGLVELIHRRAERGRAYLLISHREELATAVHRHLHVSDGRLHTVTPAEDRV